jgi:hypothetical protein
MKTQTISVVSIHPDPARPLAFDVKDILATLGPYLPRWIWCVRNLDWLGEGGEIVCRNVETAGAAGLWMTSQELLAQAHKVYQTLEGEFLAFPRDVDPKEITAEELNLRAFPASRAELALVAVDGGLFDVYAKDSDLPASLKGFRDVRQENPEAYFTS